MKKITTIILITVLLTSIFSCSKKDEQSDDGNIVIPSTFTPDGDGVNDTWFITDEKNLIDPAHFLVRIFDDSTHVKIFESTKKNFFWDGTYMGIPQRIGYYSYYIDYKTWNDQEHLRTGSIWLYRKPPPAK